MTDATVSQVATEVLRTNLAPDAVVCQVSAEILRPNLGYLGTASESLTLADTIDAVIAAIYAKSVDESLSAFEVTDGVIGSNYFENTSETGFLSDVSVASNVYFDNVDEALTIVEASSSTPNTVTGAVVLIGL